MLAYKQRIICGNRGHRALAPKSFHLTNPQPLRQCEDRDRRSVREHMRQIQLYMFGNRHQLSSSSNQQVRLRGP